MFDLDVRNLERKIPVKDWQDIIWRISVNAIAYDATGAQSLILCRKCKDFRAVAITGNFAPVGVMVKDAKGMMRSKTLKTNRELVKWFTQEHLEKCLQNEIRQKAQEYLEQKKSRI